MPQIENQVADDDPARAGRIVTAYPATADVLRAGKADVSVSQISSSVDDRVAARTLFFTDCLGPCGRIAPDLREAAAEARREMVTRP